MKEETIQHTSPTQRLGTALERLDRFERLSWVTPAAAEAIRDMLRDLGAPEVAGSKPVPVVVTIHTDDEVTVAAPSWVDVTIRYALAEGDTLCSCGRPLRRDDEGDWYHIDGAEIWGGDHSPNPDER
ncbi:hypothetical protein [Amycolatopsis sp. DSM 110486]|uniref:hypothetical protein n=1 Tax=Amycolatopsis sp. DSM 110486 TaxID=2865832 RepID=UPI001C6A70F6|nr:hypothetical protein [Amycolatopsis sp. DSM 110486]QYN17504.1 hypothetical protein K1T34_32480 [Amycolatopsis sp. DSM 110486]